MKGFPKPLTNNQCLRETGKAENDKKVAESEKKAAEKENKVAEKACAEDDGCSCGRMLQGMILQGGKKGGKRHAQEGKTCAGVEDHDSAQSFFCGYYYTCV